jgi:hypothetical protein
MFVRAFAIFFSIEMVGTKKELASVGSRAKGKVGVRTKRGAREAAPPSRDPRAVERIATFQRGRT